MVNSKIKSKKNESKKKVKKLPFEKAKHIEKPKKSDFVKEPIKFRIPWLSSLINPKKIEKPYKKDFIENNSIFRRFEWENREIISKPKKSDFTEKKKGFSFKIPWLEDLINPKNKFDEPKKSDFVEEKEKKVYVRERTLAASEVIGKKQKMTFEEDEEPTFKQYEEEPKPITEERDILASVILLNVGLAYLSFIGLLLGVYAFSISASDFASINGLFYALVIISIILSLAFCVKKNTTIGFFFTSIILIIYLGLSLFIAKGIFEVIGLLLILLAVLPIEVYNIYYNSKK